MRTLTRLLIAFIFLNSANAFANEKIISMLKSVDDMYRSTSSFAKLEMTIETPNWSRILVMDAWSKGTENSFIRILRPRKEKGVATLKKGSDMWNYFPKVNKVIKIPSSMMMGSWMGSDFTNDDLVREYRFSEDYSFKSRVEGELTVISLIPKAKTVSIWGKIDLYINTKTLVPVKQISFDEDGKEMRLANFKEVKKYGDRSIPMVMELIPLNKKGNKTTIKYTELDLDKKIEDKIFTRQNLQRRK